MLNRANYLCSLAAGGRQPRGGVARRAQPRRGIVLVIVLIVLSVLTMGAFQFSDRMMTERVSARIQGRQAQAIALTNSGVATIEAFLSQSPDDREQQGGAYDNESRFRAQLVTDGDDPRQRGYFSIVAPKEDTGDGAGGVRFGLENESARFNLNTLIYMDTVSPGSGHTLLMSLPGMTDDIADAILDWLDPDDDQREYGAERDYYSGMTPPYAPKNGPLDTVEELLQVRGVTPELLFGVDANRNGVVDGNEPAADSIAGTSDDSGSMVRGWAGYLTLNSYESNLQPDGVTPRINLNGQDLAQLQSDLQQVIDPELADFIIAYRQFGPYTGSNQASANASITVDTTQAAKATLSTVLDIIDAKVQMTTTTGAASTIVGSPLQSANLGDSLATLMDYCTVNPAAKIPGRININLASKTVMMGIPGMTVELCDDIIAKRTPEATGDNPGRRHETWLLEEQLCDLATLKALMPFITGGGDVYRAQIVGYFEQQGPAARCEVIIDATTATPRIVFFRDLSHLGRGYPLDTLGTQATQ